MKKGERLLFLAGILLAIGALAFSAWKLRGIYGETDIREEMYSSAYCLIGSLRKKLEKDPRHPRYLHTVYGVGYRFEIA